METQTLIIYLPVVYCRETMLSSSQALSSRPSSSSSYRSSICLLQTLSVSNSRVRSRPRSLSHALLTSLTATPVFATRKGRKSTRSASSSSALVYSTAPCRLSVLSVVPHLSLILNREKKMRKNCGNDSKKCKQ